jgi:hypothetical protein
VRRLVGSEMCIRDSNNGGMLDRYGFDDSEKNEVIDFIEFYQDTVRELSLRMVLKLADLRKSFPKSWQAMAKTTCMRRGA